MLSRACLRLGMFLYFKICFLSLSSASGLASCVFLTSLIFFSRLAVRLSSSIGRCFFLMPSDRSDSLSTSNMGCWELSLSDLACKLGFPRMSESYSSTVKTGRLRVLFFIGDLAIDFRSGDRLSSTFRLLFFVGESMIVDRLICENLLVSLGRICLLGFEISFKSAFSLSFLSSINCLFDSLIS